MAKILCIDDEPLMRLTTCDFLSDIGHEVLDADTGGLGLEMFRLHRPDIVLSDLRMPGGDGFLVVAHLAEESPDTPVLIISGTGTVEEAVKTMRMGAWDYLTKPLSDMLLLGTTVDKLLAKARDRKNSRQYQQGLESRNQELESEIVSWSRRHQDTVQRLETALQTSINSLNLAVKEKDPYTAGHNERVARVAVDIGQAMGLGKDELDTLLIAGLLHDIGKIGVHEAILNKRSSLSASEFEQIKSHAIGGHRILENIPFDGPVAEAVRQHHERFDGTGYPEALSGESILLEARILAVADVYEALTSNRPYRPGLAPADAAAHVLERSGTHFCPRCVDAFARVLSLQNT
ncbi:MAG: response regulator [Humidesulfovibrio sp.]|uniref:HD domain-containing phosphohydrolase n=1 Tax=Humidesulfovibrio sp. TaxID=2910988 RepID=UPI002734AABB|nr:HD domain-containing phosphohydrolase [Humidesulfovibrio sp.]MDP2847443.1 response regulator [Humidesulfovibrio sp.]